MEAVLISRTNSFLLINNHFPKINVYFTAALLRACLSAVKCRLVMIDYPDAVWSKQQVMQQLTRTRRLLGSDMFTSKVPFSADTQADWIELILAISDLVRQSSLAGKRINFTNEVGLPGGQKDITDLLDSMRKSAYVAKANPLTQSDLTIIHPAFNQLTGSGRGNFANGLFFSSSHKYEKVFFIGRDRIFFYRHLMRAFIEASRYLKSLPAVS